MTNSIYADHQIRNRLYPQDGEVEVDGAGDGYSRGLRNLGYSRVAAKRRRSRAGKASGHGFRTKPEIKTKNGFAAFASLPLCGKRALRWQEQNAGDEVVYFVGYLDDGWNHIMTVRFNSNKLERGRR